MWPMQKVMSWCIGEVCVCVLVSMVCQVVLPASLDPYFYPLGVLSFSASDTDNDENQPLPKKPCLDKV